ncbi:MAG: hypothetical protein WCG79_07640 [Verrucomicrobiota bacterium]
MGLDLEVAVAQFLKLQRGEMPHREFAQRLQLSHSMAYRYEYQLTDVKLKHLPLIAQPFQLPIEVVLGLPSARFYDLQRQAWWP